MGEINFRTFPHDWEVAKRDAGRTRLKMAQWRSDLLPHHDGAPRRWSETRTAGRFSLEVEQSSVDAAFD